MRRTITFILSIALIVNLPAVKLSAGQPEHIRSIVVEDNYYPSDTYRIVQSNNGYEKLTVHGKERYKQLVQSTKEVLHIPIYLDVYETGDTFLLPSDVDGIVMDIPFNYYSSLEASAKYFQLLLYNGWEIEHYNAGSLCVQVGLIRDDVTCRLLIYKDYLKVYCKLI